MQEPISLGVKGDINLIQSRLYHYPECSFPVSIKRSAPEAVTYIDFEATDDFFLLDRYLNVLAEYIVDRYETRMVKQILEEQHRDLSTVCKREILKNIESLSDDPQLGYTARKQVVLESVYDYLKEDRIMLLDGFVAFRLKGYEALLEQLCLRLREQYFAKREYEDFVALLKYFVSIQENRPELVHILVRPAGGYVLLDEEGKDMTAESFAEFLEGEFLLTEEAYDDLLLSVLITLAPKNIQLHGKENVTNRELFHTILRVFDGKVTDCSGCEHCKEGNKLL